MNYEKLRSFKTLNKMIIIGYLLIKITVQPIQAQNYEAQSVLYNTLIGGIAGGIGAIINKEEKQKWQTVFVKNFLVGSLGGGIMYGGKKVNYLIPKKHELGYAWLSRAIYNAGNSIVENAASNKDFWSVWHYDIGFIRIEYEINKKSLKPKLMPSSFIGMAYLVSTSNFDLDKSLRTGTPIFYTPIIRNDSSIAALTTTNGFVYCSGLDNPKLYEDFGHEIIHTFQLQDFSSYSHFLKPNSDKWKTKYTTYRKLSNWIYLDINYEVMVFNYYIINGGNKGNNYSRNFLENEASSLSSYDKN